jgi:hypothetical protein
MFLRRYFLASTASLAVLACTTSGPTEVSTDLLRVQATSTGLLLTNRSATDSVFARASYRYTGVQYWLSPLVCGALALGPQEQRVVGRAQLINHGPPTDTDWAMVETGQRDPGAVPNCRQGPRVLVYLLEP